MILEGKIQVRVLKSEVFKTLAEAIMKDISGGYGSTHTIEILTFEADNTEEASYKITFERTLKPK